MTFLSELRSLRGLHHEKRETRFSLNDELHRFESELIRDALTITFGFQRRAATILGIKTTTLNQKIKRLKMQVSNKSTLDQDAPSIAENDSEGPVRFEEAKARFEAKLIRRALTQ